jgi:hypothetical protein
MPSVSQIASLASLAFFLSLSTALPNPAGAGNSGNVALPIRDDVGPIACGCEGQKDAEVADCEKVIKWIDPKGQDGTDPMKAVKNVHTDLLTQAEVMHIEG